MLCFFFLRCFHTILPAAIWALHIFAIISPSVPCAQHSVKGVYKHTRVSSIYTNSPKEYVAAWTQMWGCAKIPYILEGRIENTPHIPTSLSAPLEGRTVDSGKSKTNNTIARRCSLNFIILSTLMMLSLNKNSPSSGKDIRQSLWLCIRGPSCHQQACSSGGILPGEGGKEQKRLSRNTCRGKSIAATCSAA